MTNATLLRTAGGRVRRRSAMWWAAVFCCLAQLGCVQRRMTIRSDPPGALVYVGDYEIGTTPVSTDYVYYGQRTIRLEKDGYETLTVKQPLPPPWYEIFPIDFFVENVVPFDVRDERTLHYPLRPQMMVPNEQLLDRAQELRQSNRVSGPLPGPVATPPAVLPAPGGMPQRGASPVAVPSYGAPPAAGAPPAVSLPPGAAWSN